MNEKYNKKEKFLRDGILSLNLKYRRRKLYKHYYEHLWKLMKEQKIQTKNILTNREKKSIKTYWKRFGIDIDLSWHILYKKLIGRSENHFIPEYIFYNYIELFNANRDMFYAHIDKNNYHRLFPNVKHPDLILKNENGIMTDGNGDFFELKEKEKEMKKEGGKYVLKPSIRSGGGNNVKILEVTKNQFYCNDKICNLPDLIKKYGKDFLIERWVDQENSYSMLHPESLNTNRLITMRIGNEIKLLSSLYRIGVGESRIDNTRNGGLVCGVDEDGNVSKTAFDKKLNIYFEHPDNKMKFEGLILPDYKKIINKVLELHNNMKYFNTASWDITLGKEGRVIMIEVNLRGQGVLTPQIITGPLLGDYTEKVLEEVFKN